jgi:hypothetical protein
MSSLSIVCRDGLVELRLGKCHTMTRGVTLIGASKGLNFFYVHNNHFKILFDEIVNYIELQCM